MPSILRANTVQFQGPLQLGLEPTCQPTPESNPEPQGSVTRKVPTEAHIRIVENHPDYALAELTCTCGKTTYVRCEYTSGEAPPTTN